MTGVYLPSIFDVFVLYLNSALIREESVSTDKVLCQALAF